MTHVILKSDQLKKIWKQISKAIDEEGKVCILTPHVDGTCYAPSRKKPYYRLTNPTVNPKIFRENENDHLNAFMEAQSFTLFLLPKELVIEGD